MVITSRFEEIVLYAIYVDFCQHEELNSIKKIELVFKMIIFGLVGFEEFLLKKL
jgi:hypothetical protein